MKAALHAKNTTLACPTCGRRITTALPDQTAICHDRHKPQLMRPVHTISDEHR